MKNVKTSGLTLFHKLFRKILQKLKVIRDKISINSLAGFIFAAAVLAGILSQIFLSSETFRPSSGYTVVLDAGHGGEDPGKVSISGVREKDINLQITLKCRTILEQNGITVILTRDSDRSIEDAGAVNKKTSDLENRKKIITENHPDCAVSIHQNSYPDPSQYGSQVFYYTKNEEGKRLASLIQSQIQYVTSKDNQREIKPNSDYYLLRDNPIPTVIAEVCFLSNPSEAEMITEEYIQEKAAFTIAMGIMQYLLT